jgi:outer membrane biosynthesis protein TonB
MMEPKKERRSLAIAILISLFLHFAVGYALAAFGGVFAPTLPPDETPPELTIVDVSEPPPRLPKNPAYVETELEKESAEKPKDQTFQSSANSVAASKVPPTGDLPLPSQDGKDRPDLNLDTHDFSLPILGSQPQPQAQQQPPAPESRPSPAVSPKAKPSEPPKSSPEPSAAVSPEPEQLAMLRSSPPPPLNAPEEVAPSPPEIPSSAAPPAPRPKPENPASNYRPQKQETRIAGSISNRDRSAVNTVGTPLGRYQKQMYDAVGARWYQHTAQKRDLISIGTTRLTFSIDRSGRITNLKVAENTANEAFASVCLQSVQELKLPPIPDDVASTLPPEGLQEELTFILYAN